MNRIQQIFNATWAIERKDYLNLISIIQPSIKAGNFADLEKLLSRDQTSIQAANLSNLAKAWDFYDENLPENSIGVITLNGMLYNWESERIALYLEEALLNSKIAGVVFKINGVGAW